MPMKIYLLVTIIMSVITFIAYGTDKAKAQRHQWRIPESTLLLLSLCGGSLGAVLGMQIFHHKTKKPKFFILVPIMLIIWIALGAYIYLGSR
jgi:uncharacterized membrane protein YsdA (DUF1294 family)